MQSKGGRRSLTRCWSLLQNQTDRHIKLQLDLQPKNILLVALSVATLAHLKQLPQGNLIHCSETAVTGHDKWHDRTAPGPAMCYQDGLCALAWCFLALNDYPTVQSQGLCDIGLLSSISKRKHHIPSGPSLTPLTLAGGVL